MGTGGLLGIFAAVTTLVGTVKTLTGSINASLVVKMVAQAFVLSKKHGVAIIGDLSKGNVEGAVTEATQWVLDEITTLEGQTVTTSSNTTASTPVTTA